MSCIIIKTDSATVIEKKFRENHWQTIIIHKTGYRSTINIKAVQKYFTDKLKQ